MDMLNTTIIYLLAIFISTLIRTMAPYIRKKLEELQKLQDGEISEPSLKYDPIYTILFLVSFIVSGLGTFVIYLENPLDMTGDPAMIFGKGIVLGLAGNWATVEIAKWFLPESFRS